MLDLLLECSIYVAVGRGKGNYYQLSGTPLTDLLPLSNSEPFLSIPTESLRPSGVDEGRKCARSSIRSPSAINFVRNRMFYARAALNAKGRVRFGLRHIHVLNRYPDSDNVLHTTHILKYIFPRQLGLHNVFTSMVDSKQTTQPFQDYTLRENEIVRQAGRLLPDASHSINRLPKRLRGDLFGHVQKMQKLHARCAYYELLKHYCPLKLKKSVSRSFSGVGIPCDQLNLDDAPKSQLVSRSTRTQTLGAQFTDVDSPDPEQGCLVMGALQPDRPVVDHSTPVSNVSAFCRAVLARLIPDAFWGCGGAGDHNKEVTMSNVDRFVRLRRFESMTLHVVFQGLKISSMDWLAPQHVSTDAAISFSDLNKRKELLLEFLYYLFDSILIPLIRSNFHVTESNHHKNRIFYFRHDVWKALTEPAMTRIKNTMLEEVPMMQARQLLDARSLGFSHIRLLPKDTGLRPIMNLRRRVTKLQGGKPVLGRSINSMLAPVHKMLEFERQQHPASVGSALFSVGDIYPKLKAFRDKLRSTAKRIPPLYFAKVDVQSCFDTIPQQGAVKIMEHLASEQMYRIARHAQIKASDHRQNGKGAYAQVKRARKFIASAHPPLDFRSFDAMIEESSASESKNTVFVDNVLRTSHKKQKLLDLLKDHVESNMVKIGKKFFRQKHGIPQGSVLSSLLCNCFYAKLEQEHLSFTQDGDSLLLRLIDDFLFITTEKKAAVRFLQTMHDGIEDAFKIQAHKMFLDTNYNSVGNVLRNIYENFTECAMKYYRYMNSMQHTKQPHTSLLIETLRSMVDMAFVLVKSKDRRHRSQDYACAVSKPQVEWLAFTAFECVLSRKQTKFVAVLAWVRESLGEVRPRDHREAARLVKVARKGQLAFRGFSQPVMLADLTDFSSTAISHLNRIALDSGLSNSVHTWDLFYQHAHCSEEDLEDLATHSLYPSIRIFTEAFPVPIYKPVSTVRKLAVRPPESSRTCLDRCITIAYDEMTSLATQAPSSPPGLTGSKSSKSSSFHSSSHEGADGLLSDITHFEDIGLDDGPMPSTRELYGFDSYANRPPAPTAATAMSGKRDNATVMKNARELTVAGQRPKQLSIQGRPKTVSGLGIIQPGPGPGPNGFKKGRSPSSPSLAQQAMSNLSRSRSPSPSQLSLRSAMLHPLNRPATLLGPLITSAVKRPPVRRGSWQPSRKSIKELEDEYNDSDEDLPDDASLWNVPLSPRPPQYRSAFSPGPSSAPSTNTSPERPTSFNPSKGSLKDLRSPRMPSNGAAGREPTKLVNGSPVIAARPIYPPSLSAETLAEHQPFTKTRAKSWTVAMSELSEEAKLLTEVLETRVGESEKLYEAAVQSGLASARPSIEKKSRSKTSVELPPLRMNNVMIDPLPISKEKEKVLSRTRPSWLPPKDQKEEKKHLKEYQRIMELSLESEKKRAARAAVQECEDDNTRNTLQRIWEEHVLPNWDQATREPRTRELWWRGIAPRSRAKVWQKAVGNDLALREDSFTKALQRAKETETRFATNRDVELPKEKAWFDAIRRDVHATFPELKIFQRGGPLHDGLVDVLMAYSMYRSDVGYSHGTHVRHLFLRTSF
ncbi:MAG: hypothetical protein L6R35_003030 [Caloplaca aegaea]|nr:MAG: hypothetical protein L6R35_003030 [Caloplaca aegaea]